MRNQCEIDNEGYIMLYNREFKSYFNIYLDADDDWGDWSDFVSDNEDFENAETVGGDDSGGSDDTGVIAEEPTEQTEYQVAGTDYTYNAETGEYHDASGKTVDVSEVREAQAASIGGGGGSNTGETGAGASSGDDSGSGSGSSGETGTGSSSGSGSSSSGSTAPSNETVTVTLSDGTTAEVSTSGGSAVTGAQQAASKAADDFIAAAQAQQAAAQAAQAAQANADRADKAAAQAAREAQAATAKANEADKLANEAAANKAALEHTIEDRTKAIDVANQRLAELESQIGTATKNSDGSTSYSKDNRTITVNADGTATITEKGGILTPERVTEVNADGTFRSTSGDYTTTSKSKSDGTSEITITNNKNGNYETITYDKNGNEISRTGSAGGSGMTDATRDRTIDEVSGFARESTIAATAISARDRATSELNDAKQKLEQATLDAEQAAFAATRAKMEAEEKTENAKAAAKAAQDAQNAAAKAQADKTNASKVLSDAAKAGDAAAKALEAARGEYEKSIQAGKDKLEAAITAEMEKMGISQEEIQQSQDQNKGLIDNTTRTNYTDTIIELLFRGATGDWGAQQGSVLQLLEDFRTYTEMEGKSEEYGTIWQNMLTNWGIALDRKDYNIFEKTISIIKTAREGFKAMKNLFKHTRTGIVISLFGRLLKILATLVGVLAFGWPVLASGIGGLVMGYVYRNLKKSIADSYEEQKQKIAEWRNTHPSGEPYPSEYEEWEFNSSDDADEFFDNVFTEADDEYGTSEIDELKSTKYQGHGNSRDYAGYNYGLKDTSSNAASDAEVKNFLAYLTKKSPVIRRLNVK